MFEQIIGSVFVTIIIGALVAFIASLLVLIIFIIDSIFDIDTCKIIRRKFRKIIMNIKYGKER